MANNRRQVKGRCTSPQQSWARCIFLSSLIFFVQAEQLLLTFFEDATQNFPRWVTGNALYKFHFSYLFVWCKLIVDPCHQFSRTLFRAVRLEYHKCFREFSHLSV